MIFFAALGLIVHLWMIALFIFNYGIFFFLVDSALSSDEPGMCFLGLMIVIVFAGGAFNKLITRKPNNESALNYDTKPIFCSKSFVGSGLEFEEYCAWLLRNNGFKNVRVTPSTNDFGADIVANDLAGKKWIFQCKFYSSKLGNSCVQEIVGAKRHYNADKLGVMTNSVLTEKARQLALENEVFLLEYID